MTPACVRSRLAEQLPGPRRHEREAVDLAVRVVQRDADLLALVLEAVHLPDPVHRAEHGRAIRPGLHYRARAARRQVGEGGVMISGEANNLASAGRRAVSRSAPAGMSGAAVPAAGSPATGSPATEAPAAGSPATGAYAPYSE